VYSAVGTAGLALQYYGTVIGFFFADLAKQAGRPSPSTFQRFSVIFFCFIDCLPIAAK